MDTGIPPRAFLKRKRRDIDFNFCIFLQKGEEKNLRQGKDAGRNRILEAAHEREKLNDTKNIDVIQ